LTAEIGFIHFDSAGEDPWNILGENSSYYRESSHDPPSFKGCTDRDILTALFNEEPSDNFSPLIPRKIERKTMRREFVLALRTASFLIA
jgi:hypothetical protein